MRTELGGWKVSAVSYGVGADMPLPPCLIGGRQTVGGWLVSETWAYGIGESLFTLFASLTYAYH